jgi:dUTP pyrophosphatase
MDKLQVRLSVHGGGSIPEYKTAGSAGADLHAAIDEPILLAPGRRIAIPTGLRIELPPGIEAQVRPRSGLALEKGITCLNSPGTIDSDYRGEIKVILINLGEAAVRIEPGDRIAQLVLARYTVADFRPAIDLSETDRGGGGFGSTGQ